VIASYYQIISWQQTATSDNELLELMSQQQYIGTSYSGMKSKYLDWIEDAKADVNNIKAVYLMKYVLNTDTYHTESECLLSWRKPKKQTIVYNNFGEGIKPPVVDDFEEVYAEEDDDH
jgi:hypothetical protein